MKRKYSYQIKHPKSECIAFAWHGDNGKIVGEILAVDSTTRIVVDNIRNFFLSFS